MDSFVKKTPRIKEKDVFPKNEKPQMKQSTIHSLKGVVVLEDILHCKSKLTIPNQDDEVILECLRMLGKKIPPKHVMLSTKIGHIVRKLRRHSNPCIVEEATLVYCKWRKHFENWVDKPQIEVRSDVKTENMRLRAKTFLAEALSVERSHAIIEAIEREAFYQNKRLNSMKYRGTMRTIVFKLKNNEIVRQSLINGDLSVVDFVKQHKKG